MMHNTEDRNWWYKHGERFERQFIDRFGSSLDVAFNPLKDTDPTVHDLLYKDDLPADLKTQTEPFWTASRYKLIPDTTVTLNGKDINRYKERYPNILLFFWVRFSGGVKYNTSIPKIEAVYVARLHEIIGMIDEGLCPCHEYQRRKGDSRNAKHSYLIDTKMLRQVFPR